MDADDAEADTNYSISMRCAHAVFCLHTDRTSVLPTKPQLQRGLAVLLEVSEMIVSNRFVRAYLFGSKVAGIHNKSFQCCVSTAKEGLFQKQSTIILEPRTGNAVGAGATGLRPCGKVIYSPTLRTSDRFQFHDVIAKTLDELGEEGCTLEEALEQIFADLKRRGIVVETMNLAADQGQAGVQFTPGMVYTNGEGISQDDFTQAAVLCREVAEQGYPKAQLMLGELYGSGDGVPQDYAQAAFWYRKAAEQGNAQAQYNLGTLYSNGHGVPQDYEEACFWSDIATAGELYPR